MRNIWYLIIIYFLVISTAGAQEYKTKTGKVEFLSKASLNEFTGKSNDLNGLVDLNKNLIDFYVDLNSLKTGIGLRDRHMRDNYLETKKFPFAEFTGQINQEVDLKIGESRDVTAKGKFKIHGVERNITVPGKITRINNGEIKLEAQFPLLLSDYKIDIPKVVFYELAEEQQVSINAILQNN